jgi:hypothetical protein
MKSKKKPLSKAAKCFLFSEDLSAAVNSAAEAHNEAINLTRSSSTRRFDKAIRYTKDSLAAVASVPGAIGRKAKGIVRELAKESLLVSDGAVPLEARYKRFTKAMDKVFYDIALLKSESARQCGVVRYDELSEAGGKLFSDFEAAAAAELKRPPADITAWPGPKFFNPTKAEAKAIMDANWDSWRKAKERRFLENEEKRKV